MTTVNGKIAKPGTIIRNGDRIQCVALLATLIQYLTSPCRNMVHRHEPPITSTPIEILVTHPDYIIINKPGSIVRDKLFLSCHLYIPDVIQPVHATGRFYKHSLVHILRNQLGLDKIHSAWVYMMIYPI